jgi:hypothetical protein
MTLGGGIRLVLLLPVVLAVLSQEGHLSRHCCLRLDLSRRQCKLLLLYIVKSGNPRHKKGTQLLQTACCWCPPLMLLLLLPADSFTLRLTLLMAKPQPCTPLNSTQSSQALLLLNTHPCSSC